MSPTVSRNLILLRPDIVVGIDNVIDLNLDALAAMESQFLEGGVEGSEAIMPKNKARI